MQGLDFAPLSIDLTLLGGVVAIELLKLLKVGPVIAQNALSLGIEIIDAFLGLLGYLNHCPACIQDGVNLLSQSSPGSEERQDCR